MTLTEYDVILLYMTTKQRNALMKTARFWTRINGDWVRLALVAGASIETHHSERTDEGFRTEARYFERSEDGAEIFYQEYTRERDCDGLHSHSGEGKCLAVNLAVREGYEAPGLLPRWNA